MRVLVLDGNENQAVASVRSLARAGHRVEVGADTSWSKAGLSRGASSRFVYPAPQSDSSAFVKAVAQRASSEPGTLVMPMTERTTLPLSAGRSQLVAVGARLVVPSHETLLRAYDKAEMTRLAESLGVTVPKTVILRADADAHVADFGALAIYPVVLKPRSSEIIEADGRVRATGAPLYARSRMEFTEAFAAMSRRADEILVQEYVEGRGAGYFALVRDGEPCLEFAHRRIRDVRPTGSGSAVRESVAVDRAVGDAGRAVLRALRWQGVAMVEFRVRPDGTPVFLEVNGRFWNSLALAVHAGADFPAMLAELAEHGVATPRTPYRVGIRCRWFLGDVRHLVAVLKGRPAGYAGEFPRRLRTLTDFLTPVPGTVHDNFSLADPLPELGDWLDFLGRRVPAAIRARHSPGERTVVTSHDSAAPGVSR